MSPDRLPATEDLLDHVDYALDLGSPSATRSELARVTARAHALLSSDDYSAWADRARARCLARGFLPAHQRALGLA